MRVALGVSTPASNSTRALGWGAKLRLVGADIKLAHSVFALPFALLAAFLVAPRLPAEPVPPGMLDIHGGVVRAYYAPIDWSVFGGMLGLIVACMFLARTWAMVVNRVADRSIDAENPRTTGRAFAARSLSGRDGLLVLAGSALAFLGVCALFWIFYDNPWPTLLSWIVLAWIAFYSFTKRFTWLCHVFLGGALAVSPLAAAVAVGGIDALSFQPADWLQDAADQTGFHVMSMTISPFGAPQGPGIAALSLMVLLWVAGFDVIYALQDMDFDRQHGLRSIPARFGWKGAAWISRALHVGAVLALAIAWRVEPRFGWLFGVGLGVVVAALIWEHAVLARRGRAGIPMAFFTLNGVVALTLGAFGIADVLV